MPLGFINEAVVSSFFLLREIEASLMLTKRVHFNSQDSTITVWLPALKNDPGALIGQRTWGCVARACRAQGPVHTTLGLPSVRFGWSISVKTFRSYVTCRPSPRWQTPPFTRSSLVT